MRRSLFIAAIMVLGVTGFGRAAEDPALAVDEETLHAVGIASDGSGLLTFLKGRTTGTVAPKRIAALVEQLGARNAAVREKACGELIAIGPAVIPALRVVAKDVDLPVSSDLARRCLTALEKNSAMITSAVVRLLAQRQPDGAAETLLTFLPAVEDERVLEEIKTALVGLAVQNGKPVAPILKALEDPVSLRRGVAIEVLGQTTITEPTATFRRLLKDQSPSVRLRASLALAQLHDSTALDVMIGLLGEVPLDQGRLVEEYLVNLAGDTSPKAMLSDDASRAKARDAWLAWWQAHDGASVLQEFHKRTVTDTDLKKAAELIAQLGDENYETREAAMKALRAMGQVAMRPLHDAAGTTDLEVRNRIRDLLADMERDKSLPLSPVAARLLALRKPAGAAEAILNFMPFTSDLYLLGEVQTALNAVAFTDSKLEPAVLRALEDRSPLRRAAAVEALCQRATPEQQAAARKLLNDPDAGVRLQAALALVGLQDKAAIPVLIAQIREADPDRAAYVEELLTRMAGDKAPANLPNGFEDEPRRKRSEAWSKWWTANASQITLPGRQALTATRMLGYTLIVEQQQQQVVELGPDGKERWHINGLVNPMDARVLPNGRVLIAEMGNQRVTERTLKGDIVWQKQVLQWPISAERLPNGTTFIVTRNQILEVDRNGKELFTHNRPQSDIMSAFKGRDGQYVVLSNQGVCFRLDAAGREGKAFHVEGVSNFGNELLPNGHLLVPLAWQNKVTEYDTEGKAVWEARNIVQPMAVCRLPNGNTLVSTQNWPNKLIEIDRAGKQVAQTDLPGFAARIRRR